MDHTTSLSGVNDFPDDFGDMRKYRLPGTNALSVEYWAIISAVEVKTVKEWVADKKIPHRLIGRVWWIEPADFLAAFPKTDTPVDQRRTKRK
jgi:hypothetical protein